MADGSTTAMVLAVVLIAVVVAGIGSFAASAPTVGGSDSGPPPTQTDATTLDRLHSSGVTGANVTVGVVDVTGFDATHPALASQVVDARSFTPGETVRNGGNTDHGTAAASLVTRVAPESRLYLASFDTASGYRRAVEWLLDRGVDVIVAPVTFYGKPGDGSARVSRVGTRAVNAGVVFVVPVGNLAQRHWRGRYDPVRNGTHHFGDGTRNYVATDDGDELRVWLSWDDRHGAEDYTAELYWTNGTASRLVARSQPYRSDSVPNERIVASLSEGAYYVVVRGPRNETGARIRLSSPTHRLQYHDASRSVTAPATGRDVLAVGAYDDARDGVEPFSGHGPVGERLGVDVVAPDGLPAASKPEGFEGSSAAAPYAAGVAALVLDADPDRSPRAVEATLERTAIDVGNDGPDEATGYGRVDPVRAIERVRNASG
ncbi:S8 family serine peptidase [Haloarculaceae archaeon H-GB2-1]|nr:S8 family serine peptidase [Haloarculaceae archaeon H-GB1-1]MEA5387797.1 S8 family serine peptidase [Haloarculaceae archaeon H-GB11]MEA5409296.1 S8 family serine peptidase [Haloarculaceae archaeon H-GB2-1]